MSKDKAKMEFLSSPKNNKGQVDLNAMEMIFGKPNMQKTGHTDVHTIANERNGDNEKAYTNSNTDVYTHEISTENGLSQIFLVETESEPSCSLTFPSTGTILQNKKQESEQHSPAVNENTSQVHEENTIKNNRQIPDSDVEIIPTQPLLEPDREKQKPPLAGPEVDDLDEDKPTDAVPYPGIDDGLLEPADKKPEHGDDDSVEHADGDPVSHDDGATTADGNWWRSGADEPDFAHDGANGFDHRFDDRPISPMFPGSIPDVNTYQQKKNLAQGMMDLALLSANANQLRYVLESSASHPYFYPSLVFISLSIILQIAVGVGLIMNSRYDVKDEKDICKADKINNMTVLGVFLVTIVNVFITSFSVASNGSAVVQQAG